MNNVSIAVEKIEGALFTGKAEFGFVVVDDYIDDIKFTALASPGLLDGPDIDVVKLAMESDSEALDVIQAALMNGTAVHVNGATVSPDALASLRPMPTP